MERTITVTIKVDADDATINRLRATVREALDDIYDEFDDELSDVRCSIKVSQ